VTNHELQEAKNLNSAKCKNDDDNGMSRIRSKVLCKYNIDYNQLQ